MLTPPQVAKRLGVKPEKVIRWIRRGELEAIDVTERLGLGRPRFRIGLAALEKFEAKRTVQPSVKVERKKRSPDVKEFF